MSSINGENEAKKGGSLAAWLILGILALAFGLSFGLPSDSLSLGPQAYARVHGESIQREDFAYQLNAFRASGSRVPEDERYQQLTRFRQTVLEAVVERHVLAEAAEASGMAAVTADAEDLTAAGHTILLGLTLDWLQQERFDYDLFKGNLLARLQVSEKQYLEIQRLELLARTMRDLVAASTVVPEAELREQFDRETAKISLQYARFSPTEYSDQAEFTEAEVDAYLSREAETLEAEFEKQKARFTGLSPQVAVRVLKINRPAAPEAGANEVLLAAHAQKLQQSELTLTRATQLIASDGFASAARRLSDDPGTARAGGALGWLDLAQVGARSDDAVQAAVADAGEGLLDTVVTDKAWWLVQLDGKREGDVAKEDALRELAHDAMRAQRGVELARVAAQDALAKLEEGASWNQVFALGDAMGAEGGGIDSLGASGGTASEPRHGFVKPFASATGLFGPKDPIPGLGNQRDIADAAWEAKPGGKELHKVFETSDGLVIVELDERIEATDEGFASSRAALFARARDRRAARLTSRFAHRRCLEARGRGDIVPNDGALERLMTYDVRLEEGEEPLQLAPYSMCESTGTRGSALSLPLLAGGAGR